MNQNELLWQKFAQDYALTQQQQEQFEKYYEMLVASNKLFNLTALTDLHEVLTYHFADSLELGKCIDMHSISTMADVGTGAGFPGLALKIKYPHLKVILIEVLAKRVNFLESVIQELGLVDVTIDSKDWRTFLRTTTYPVDLFCARASLQPQELIRMFQPSCVYRKAQLVYWASALWEPMDKERSFIRNIFEYKLDHKLRKYVRMTA